MASFNVVNYSLRPSKSIQRSLVFEGVRMLQSAINLEDLLYVGFGSIWFTDFQLAHKILHVRDMISMESSEIGFRRARFNQPFKTVRVEHGLSSEILPQLYASPQLKVRPWLIWLDYDKALQEEMIEDLRLAVETAPPNSVLLTTFSAKDGGYGAARDRPKRLQSLLGRVVPDDLSRDMCRDESLGSTLVELTTAFLLSVAAAASRPGGFIPAFQMRYRDVTPMVTVGGVLPAKGAVPAVAAMVGQQTWPGIVGSQISAPHLTLREAAVLQSQLPHATPLDRAAIQALGFDLEEDAITSFQRYYRYYPSFAQITM